MNVRVLLLVWVVSTALVGCGEDESRPAMLVSNGGLTHPFSCDGLREATVTPDDCGRFVVGGAVAQCVAEGQWCPTPWLADRCEAGISFARCAIDVWLATCEGGDGA
ncbi:MAG: hypothetical protein CSA75_02800 [Sorangium cellulosum]|nr:MAG: hypothetical protein CSA75_02800 [Sorangium cellulosum]